MIDDGPPREGVRRRGSTTAIRAFDRFYREGEFRPPLVFLESVFAAWLGIACGYLVFRTEVSLVAISLVAIYQAPTARGLFDRNRREIFFDRLPPRRANLRLASALAVVFGGVLVAFLVASTLAPAETLGSWLAQQVRPYGAVALEGLRLPSLVTLLRHNGGVLAGCFLIALVYRHGGMLLVLSWNAATWGVILSLLVLGSSAAGTGSVTLAMALATILPHLVLEALAYVIASMAGTFLARGLARHGIETETFSRVGVAVLQLLALALALLLAAAFVESSITPIFLEAASGRAI